MTSAAIRVLHPLQQPLAALLLAWLAALGLVLHSDRLLATLAVLGAGGAFLAGLTGVGGAVVMIPLLLYVPPWVGAGQLGMHDVTSLAMSQVFAAAASGVVAHARGGFVDRRLVVQLAGGMVPASLAGAVASRWLSAEVLQALFAVMALAGAAALLFPGRQPDTGPRKPAPALGVSLAALTGLLAGAVGAGGAFLLIPLMLRVLHVPPRIAVGSALAVTLATAAAGLAGKVATAQLAAWPALALVAGALPAAQLGAAVSRRLPTGALRLVLAALISIVALRMAIAVAQ